jgi:hypothetical protein
VQAKLSRHPPHKPHRTSQTAQKPRVLLWMVGDKLQNHWAYSTALDTLMTNNRLEGSTFTTAVRCRPVTPVRHCISSSVGHHHFEYAYFRVSSTTTSTANFHQQGPNNSHLGDTQLSVVYLYAKRNVTCKYGRKYGCSNLLQGT